MPSVPPVSSAPLGGSALLDQLDANFHSAVAACDSCSERWFLLGGVRFRLRFAGPRVSQAVARALAHLEVLPGGESADVTLDLFDQRDSSLLLPPPPRDLADFSPRGDIRNFNTVRIKAAFQPFGRILSAFDTTRRHGVVSYGDLPGLYNFERATPLRGVIAWCLRTFAVQLVHAGAVGCAQGAVLLGGKGGSGKSNTALACLHAGLDFLSDDFCAVTARPRPTVFSLYATSRTRTADWARLPFLAPLADRTDSRPQDKELYYLHPAFSRQLATQRPLRAILVPVIDPQRPLQLRPASPREAVLALAPVTTSLLPDAGGEILAHLSAVVRQVPCFHLHLGPDVNAIPEAIRSLLRELGGN